MLLIDRVRFGNWKAVKNRPDAAIELYDLEKDVAESNDLAGEKPELVARAAALMKSARVEDPNWPLENWKPPQQKTPKKKPPKK